MKTRIGVAIITVAFLLYIVLAGQRAIVLLGSGDTVAVIMGAALIFFPIIALWMLYRELRFGRDAERLGVRLEEEGGLPPEEVTLLTSGRVERSEGDALFPKYRDAAQQNPDDWRAMYRLGLVYDAAGDRKRARAAIRRAIERERETRR